MAGSTAYIVDQVRKAPPGASWAIGTEVHLVNRLRQQHPDQRIVVLSDCQCLCTTMYRIDLPHLCWVLENLVEGKVVNEIKVDAHTRRWSLVALERMLAIKGTGNPIGKQQPVGAWCIVARIGGGGMGEVYRAERVDGQFAQEVAIKVMRDGYNPEGLAARFKAERQILASLDHPNLAKVLDGGITEDGEPYFVMELVDGEPIDVHVARRRLSIDERVRLFRSVCQVVHYAHQKRVVHRDLKADNILVRHDGVVKLVDFGIAKRIEPGAAETVTRTACVNV
jgi:hypothetical protein